MFKPNLKTTRRNGVQGFGICYIIWIVNIYCCLRAAASAEICRKILAGLRKKTDRWIMNAKITNHITARMHCAGAVTYQSQQSDKAAAFLLALCRAMGRNRTCSDSYAESLSVKVGVKLSDFTAHRCTDANQSQRKMSPAQLQEAHHSLCKQ